MPLEVRFSGRTPEQFAKDYEKAATVTEADMLYVLNRQKSRILDRTQNGLDINGTPFAPYSRRGPYYYYPGGAVGRKMADKSRKGAASRFARKVGGVRTRVGVKFASYADFKASMGRGVVDLTGPRAPHMLQAIVVKATSTGGVIGIYGSEADRAEGHNIGAGRLPKREFFGFGAGDEDAANKDLETILSTRISKIL